jgi:hypothetical protein
VSGILCNNVEDLPQNRASTERPDLRHAFAALLLRSAMEAGHTLPVYILR